VSDAWSKVATFIPKLVIFLVILAIGFVIAKAMQKAAERILWRLSFDRAAFLNTYSEDPARAQEAGIRFGDTIEKMGGTMSTNLTSVITGRNNEISSLNDQISNWDVRLAAKREALQKQYSDLEVALGKLKDQSSWLSGQLAGLS